MIGNRSSSGHTVVSAEQFQFLEAVMWQIGEINRDPAILPNLTVGWTVLDDKGNDQVTCVDVM